jgi:hypothetical protein
MVARCPPVTMNYSNLIMHNPLDTELNLQRILIFPAAAKTLFTLFEANCADNSSAGRNLS